MKPTIIIFDDDAEILQICAIILKSRGYNVVTENSCEQVVKKVEDSGAGVILMDNSIPNSGGIEATRTIKQTASIKHIPVIFFSANSNIILLSQQAGAEYFLPKPFDISELEAVVSHAINKPPFVAS
jgi:two-component system cell cycle response regulator DivK